MPILDAERLLMGQHYSINYRVDRNTRSVLTSVGHTQNTRIYIAILRKASTTHWGTNWLYVNLTTSYNTFCTAWVRGTCKSRENSCESCKHVSITSGMTHALWSHECVGNIHAFDDYHPQPSFGQVRGGLHWYMVVFIYGKSIDEHVKHLLIVLKTL